MNYPGSRVLETARLTLRPFCAADAQQAFDNWMSDPLVTQYLTWAPHGDIAFTRRLLAAWEEEAKLDDVFHWAIVLRGSGEVVGDISVVSLDRRAESAQVGYCLCRRLWGRGIMTEALSAVIGYLFAAVGVWRIEGTYVADNAASGRVMEKCGMQREGVARQAWVLPSGERADLVHRAVLRGEWQRSRRGAARWVNLLWQAK